MGTNEFINTVPEDFEMPSPPSRSGSADGFKDEWVSQDPKDFKPTDMDPDHRPGLQNAVMANRYMELASLTNSYDVVFRDPERSKGNHSYWITGKEYGEKFKKKYDRRPTVDEMDQVESLIRDNRAIPGQRGYHPKATLIDACEPRGNDKKNWEQRKTNAEQILQLNGLSGKTYGGMVPQSKDAKGNNVYGLEEGKRWVNTRSGRKLQQRAFKNPEHAGIGNENHLLIIDEGNDRLNIQTIDITRDSKEFGHLANMTLDQAEQALGGQLLHKSQRRNGYHTADALGPKAAKESWQRLTGQERNTNERIPPVGFFVQGNLYDVMDFGRLAETDNEKMLVEAIRAGDRDIALSVTYRSPKGDLWPLDYAAKNDPDNFEKRMREYGIAPRIGVHEFTRREKQEHLKFLPAAMVTTGRGIKPIEMVIADLQSGDTIATRYNSNKILLANKAQNTTVHGTGFYTQAANAIGRMPEMLPKAVRAMHLTCTGEHRPDLAHLSLRPDYRFPESGTYKVRNGSSGTFRGSPQKGRYEPRNDHSRQSGRAG